MSLNYWGERERAPSLVHSQAGGVTIYVICYIVRSSSPRINCSTLYATPVVQYWTCLRKYNNYYWLYSPTTCPFPVPPLIYIRYLRPLFVDYKFLIPRPHEKLFPHETSIFTIYCTSANLRYIPITRFGAG